MSSFGSPAFQRIGNQFDGTSSGYGSAYGSDYGGLSYHPYKLPDLEVPSDDLRVRRRVRKHEIVHRREGAIIGARKFAETAAWDVAFHAIDEEDVDELAVFFGDREFWLLPYGDTTAPKIRVRWSGDEFPAKALRGGYFDLKFTIEEVL